MTFTHSVANNIKMVIIN